MSDYIPFSVQAAIMKRLPTKSLLQFRTVSKTWKSLIDSSKFIIDHAVNHDHQKHLLLCYRSRADPGKQKVVSIVDDETFPEKKCSLPDPIAGLGLPTVLGSSRGLFCLFCRGGDPDEPGRLRHTAVLWNPSIRKSIVIDVPYELTCPCTNIAIGFGVCPRTVDPKIVKIIYRYLSTTNLGSLVFAPWEVEVYTLSSRAWKSIPTINQPRNSIHFTGNEVVTDGFMYWLVVDCSVQEYNMIVSFDMAREEFKEVSLPDTLVRASQYNMVISKLMESLVVVEMVQEANKKVYDVWMMEHGVTNSFTKLYTINSPDASIGAVLGFRRNNEPIFSMRSDASVRHVRDADYFFVHELHTEHLSYVGISGNSDSRSASSYMETLLLLDQ